MNTPANAIGIDPTHSHFTSGHRTVLRRICTPPPTGFMTMAAIRSEETAAVGLMPKKITRIGVMRAPPPMPVIPTTKPTIAPASTMAGSICTPHGSGRVAEGSTTADRVAEPLHLEDRA